MPTYEYVCLKCGRPFEIRASLSEYSKGIRPKCPQCGSEKTIRAFRSVNVWTASRATARGSGGPGGGCGPGCACG